MLSSVILFLVQSAFAQDAPYDLNEKITTLETLNQRNGLIVRAIKENLNSLGAGEYKIESTEVAGDLGAVIAGTRPPYLGDYPDPYVLLINSYLRDLRKAKYDFATYLLTIGHESSHHYRILKAKKLGLRTNEVCADYLAATIALPLMTRFGGIENYISANTKHTEVKLAAEYCKNSKNIPLCTAGTFAAYRYALGMEYFMPRPQTKAVSLSREEKKPFVATDENPYPTNQCRLDLMKRSVKCVADQIAIADCTLPVCLEKEPALMKRCN